MKARKFKFRKLKDYSASNRKNKTLLVFAIVLVLIGTAIVFYELNRAGRDQSLPVTLNSAVDDPPEGPGVPPTENSDPTQPPNLLKHKVIRVIDGDTVVLDMSGQATRVRLISVNTPETVHPSKPQECFGKEASNYTKKKLSGKTVAVEFDQSQGRTDKYNRLLVYLWLDGKNFNLELIKAGYAYEYTYNVPYKYQDEFKQAQKYAEKNNKGLWSPKTCNGKKDN